MSETGESKPFDGDPGKQDKGASRSFRDALRQVNVRMVLGVLAAVALIVFIAQNTHDAQVSFLGWDWDLPVFLLMLITIALTVVCAQIVGWYMARRKNKR